MKKVPVVKKKAAKKSSSKKTKATVSKKPAIEKHQDITAFQPDLLKNDLVRQTIITILWRKEEATIPFLIQELKKEIGHHFDGDIERYVEKVKHDLEIKKLMELSPGKKPVQYRLSQKLDKNEDD